jgi:hypothetical protein
MIILSRPLLFGLSPSDRLDAPIILWQSLVSADTLTVSSEDDDYPASNMATDPTIEYWRAATTGPVTIDVDVSGHEVDAIAFARHNFGSTHATLTIEALVSVDGGPDEWVLLIEEQMPGNDGPLLFRFEKLFALILRVTISGGTAAPSAAVCYAGELLVMPHGISEGHVPLDQAHETQVVNGRSEAGDFLGRIITGQNASTSAQFEMLPIDWYYAVMEPFVARGMTGPFFFAWLPKDRPQDVGYAWLNTDPKPNMGSLFFDITLDYGGITR